MLLQCNKQNVHSSLPSTTQQFKQRSLTKTEESKGFKLKRKQDIGHERAAILFIHSFYSFRLSEFLVEWKF